MDRTQRLNLLKAKRAQEKSREAKALEQKLDSHVEGIKQALSEGVSLNNLDELFIQLDNIKKLAESIEQLKNTLSGIKFPDIPKSVRLQNPNLSVKPEVKVVRTEDIFAVYKAANSDEAKDTEKYFGFVSSSKWFILREMGDKAKTWMYATGNGRYREAWASRIRQDYKYFNEVSL